MFQTRETKAQPLAQFGCKLKLLMDHLDENGRCCGKKPLVYKRDGYKFCSRCDKAFDIKTGEQIENWAWQRWPSEAARQGIAGDFVRIKPGLA